MIALDDDPLELWRRAADVLRERIAAVVGDRPLSMAMIAGSGVMEAFADTTAIIDVPYRDLPGIPLPTVAGHVHSFRVLEIDGRLLGLFCGRFHFYEGHNVATVMAPIALTKLLGIEHLLISNAAGGLHPLSSVGDVMIVADLVLACNRSIPSPRTPLPLRGRPVIDHNWTQAIVAECNFTFTPIRQGTYVQVLGPSYETRAEIRMMRRMGADAIGMSTGVEAHYAHALGISVCAFSMITNTLSDTSHTIVTHAEVLDAAITARWKARRVIEAAIKWVSLSA